MLLVVRVGCLVLRFLVWENAVAGTRMMTMNRAVSVSNILWTGASDIWVVSKLSACSLRQVQAATSIQRLAITTEQNGSDLAVGWRSTEFVATARSLPLLFVVEV